MCKEHVHSKIYALVKVPQMDICDKNETTVHL